MTVELEKAAFKGLDEDHLRLNDPGSTACRLHSNGTHVIGFIPLNECGTMIKVMGKLHLINVIAFCEWLCLSWHLLIWLISLYHLKQCFKECSCSAGGRWKPFVLKWDHHLWGCQRHRYQETSFGSSVFLPVPKAWKRIPWVYSPQGQPDYYREGLWDVHLQLWVLPRHRLRHNDQSTLLPAGLWSWR